jgi:hypothetical protein
VSVPGIEKLLSVIADKLFRFSDGVARNASVHRKGNARHQLEIGFPVWMRNVDMRMRLFSREEKKPKRALAINRWRHGGVLAMQSTWLLALAMIVGCGARAVPVDDEPASKGLSESEGTGVDGQLAAIERGEANRLVAGGPLSDVQWAEVAGLAGLEELVLDGGFDDARAEMVAGLPGLSKLVARHASLTDDGFVALARCESLRELNIPQAGCTTEGIAALAALPGLQSLRIGGPQLEGAAVCEAVVSLPKLRFVHLIDVPIGDAGLAVLAQRPDLWSLYLDGAGVSDEAWAGYFQACPNVHVHVDQAHHDRDPGREHD